MRKLSTLLLPVVAVAAAACSRDLAITNPNNPDVPRVLARPSDVETSIGNSYARMQQAAFGFNASITPALLTMSFENSSDLNNWAMGPRSSIPRVTIANSRGNLYQDENFTQFNQSARAGRTAADGINSLDAPGFTLGTTSADIRARAFAWLVIGTSNGNVALAYDSLTPVTPQNKGATPTLMGAQEAMTLALQQIDSAIAYAGQATFTLPDTWVNGNALTSAQLIQLARGWKARLRAGVARTPAQRAAVNWDAVIADAQGALTGDLMVTQSNAAGSVWTIGDAQHYTYDTWSQMSPMIIGMADSARNCGAGGDCYDGWLQTSLVNRYAFLIKTADRRFPSGETRNDQRASSGAGDFPSPPPGTNLYFRNRRPSDPAGAAFNLSQYDYYRFQEWSNTRNGPYPLMTRAEMDLLMAEGYIRKKDFTNAMAKINISRVGKGGLPALTGITSETQPISTAGNCVPRVPQPPSFTTAACGNIMEAMKWEKRMETAFTHFGAWFFDSRGWGDLPEGTPLEYPVPFQELDVRGQPLYNLGGFGGVSSAAKGTYGY